VTISGAGTVTNTVIGEETVSAGGQVGSADEENTGTSTGTTTTGGTTTGGTITGGTTLTTPDDEDNTDTDNSGSGEEGGTGTTDTDNSGSGSGEEGGGDVDNSGEEESSVDVDSLMTAAITATNEALAEELEDSNFATVGELQGNTVTVTLDPDVEGVTVENVSEYIIKNLLNGLNNKTDVKSISTTAYGGSGTVTYAGENAEAFVTGSTLHTIEKSTSAQKAVTKSTPASQLSGQTLELVVTDAEDATHTYQLSFTTDVIEADIDNVIEDGIASVNTDMGDSTKSGKKNYAQLSWDSSDKSSNHNTHTVTVTMDTANASNVTVTDVYFDIIQTLIDALGENQDRARSVSVGNAGVGNSGMIVLVSDANGKVVTEGEIKALVLTSGLHYTKDYSEKNKKIGDNVDGLMPILDLVGQSVTVTVTTTNGLTCDYTVVFESGTITG
jgi:hypothetical protein